MGTTLIPGDIIVPGTANISGALTLGAGATGTGNLGTLTAGTGILGTAQSWTAIQTFGNNISFGGATLSVTSLASNDILQYNGTNWVNVLPTSLGLVNSVSNSDGSLTISPTTGSVVASLNTGHGNTWTVAQTFAADIDLTGSSNIVSSSTAATSGTTTQNSGNLDLLGSYWNGSAAIPYGARLFWHQTATTPAGHWSFNLDNNGTITELMTLDQAGNLTTVVAGATISLSGATSGTTALKASATASGTLTLQAVTDTLAVLGTAQTFTALQTFGNNISFGGATVSVSGLTTNQVLQYNGTNWVNATVSVTPAATTGSTGTAVGTTATTVLTFTPGANGLYEIRMSFSSSGSTTLTCTVTYSDVVHGATTINIATSASITAGVLTVNSFLINAASGTAIIISATAGAATTITGYASYFTS